MVANGWSASELSMEEQPLAIMETLNGTVIFQRP